MTKYASSWSKTIVVVSLILSVGCQEPLVIPAFGDGSDGNCVFENDESGCLGVRHVGGVVYELQRDVQARNAMFIGHALLLTQGHKLYVNHTLDLTQASLVGESGVR